MKVTINWSNIFTKFEDRMLTLSLAMAHFLSENRVTFDLLISNLVRNYMSHV